nr:hypothetical protein BN993_05257 [Virgibacillus halodenitrificans]
MTILVNYLKASEIILLAIWLHIVNFVYRAYTGIMYNLAKIERSFFNERTTA